MTATALTAPAGIDVTASGYAPLRQHRSGAVLVSIRSGSLAARVSAVALVFFLAAAPALTTTTTTTTTAAAQNVSSHDVHNLAGGELWGG